MCPYFFLSHVFTIKYGRPGGILQVSALSNWFWENSCIWGSLCCCLLKKVNSNLDLLTLLPLSKPSSWIVLRDLKVNQVLDGEWGPVCLCKRGTHREREKGRNEGSEPIAGECDLQLSLSTDGWSGATEWPQRKGPRLCPPGLARASSYSPICLIIYVPWQQPDSILALKGKE